MSFFKQRSYFTAALLIPGMLLATNPPPFPQQRAVIDQLSRAVSSSQSAPSALRLLEKIIEADWDLSGKRLDFGGTSIASQESVDQSLKVPFVRAYAVERLADLNVPEAYQYLDRLSTSKEISNQPAEVKNAVRVGYWRSRTRQEPNAAKRTELLKEALGERIEGVDSGITRSWAEGQLCDIGDPSLLPIIKQSIHDRDPFKSGDDDTVFCEMKVSMLSKSSNRLLNLIEVLGLAGQDAATLRLKKWSVTELAEMNTAVAKAAILNYRQQLSSRPPNDREAAELSPFLQDHIEGRVR